MTESDLLNGPAFDALVGSGLCDYSKVADVRSLANDVTSVVTSSTRRRFEEALAKAVTIRQANAEANDAAKAEDPLTSLAVRLLRAAELAGDIHLANDLCQRAISSFHLRGR